MKYLIGLLLSILLTLFCSGSDLAVTALASITDPQKLATLEGERAANDRLLKCIYWLEYAKAAGKQLVELINRSVKVTKHFAAHAALLKQRLLRNLDIAGRLRCLTPDNGLE